MDSQETPNSFTATPAEGTRNFDSEFTQLRKALSNEKFSPEILQFQQTLFEGLSYSVQEEEKRLSSLQPRPESTLVDSLHWNSLNRAKYLMRAYIRIRLWKIEEHVLFILIPDNGLFTRLSEHEQDYATRYTGLVDEHMSSAALGRLPARFRSLVQQMEPEEDPEQEEGALPTFDMIPTPDTDTFVFCRPLEDIGNYEVDGESFELTSMKIYMMRYVSIQRLVENGQMELL
mmetsp:Transcript_31489/g.43711  ORF Transcript_31489/g.43711 Transcript_31489/m.43711 type:complete len:231 (+) Transcript_31489:214-906(+)|eukprot:CAMPEP_0196572360 /NCGR_PEP_ID=MMETSP1081-20130531/2429_1 /TAXON_ID=36882 /ORGANISM="Pyramimonas amylifera, Strain CCMP720" /LENGTH=230 /DNA_ID=CAMNT_0041889663 /DNA_START=214 /DNA_END=906 /DNA_ORIENTATION=-